VGGIEAAAAMLGQPLDLVLPDVIGVRLSGRLREGVTPTDLTLTLTQMLRKIGVVNKFVEYFGSGLSALSLADRAMIANMTPENGSTMGFFPVDEQTLSYLRLSGRSSEQMALVEAYYQEQQLFRTDTSPDPKYTQIVELDLASIEPSLAGPRRPQDRVSLAKTKGGFSDFLTQPSPAGLGLGTLEVEKKVALSINGTGTELSHGSVVIAAITSCTNTSDTFCDDRAGLLAKKAVALGLRSKPWVKTSLTPGSRVVTSYLEKAGLIEPHIRARFHPGRIRLCHLHW
jgi:aconitate hydratase